MISMYARVYFIKKKLKLMISMYARVYFIKKKFKAHDYFTL
jgi:hypothetical protein